MAERVIPVLALLLLAGCAVDPDAAPGASQRAIVIPGPWDPPPETRAIAATQFVPVVDPPPVSPDGYCTSSDPFACSCIHPACTPAHPGTSELREYLLARFPGVLNYGTYCCRQNSNRLTHLSVHAIGRAIDLGVPTIGGDADNTVGDEVANFLVENAEYIGIQRVIWDHTYWNGERGFGSLGGSPHVNHLHVELSLAGAARETLFFTVGAPSETCTPQCVGDRFIAADCSSTDCAASGAECLDDPPRCGEPPPPEPPEAVLVADAAFPAVTTVGDPMRLTFTGPTRLFDTRASMERLTWNAADSELTYASDLDPSVAGIWLNLAAVATDPGYVTVYPTGSPRPATSNINTSGRVRANLVPTPLGADASVTFFELEPVEVIGDLYATMGATGDGLELIEPTRVLDTRSIDMPLVADSIREVAVGAPEGATGVLATIAALRPESDGFVQVFPCGRDTESSTVNVLGGEIASNQVVSALSADGTICLRSRVQDMHAVLDVIGFFSPEGRLEYQPLTPTRLVDTRNGTYFENRLGAHQTIELPLGDAPGMPDNGWAAVLNVATLQSDGDGHLTVFACERGTAPGTSAHNFSSDVRATLVTTDLGDSRRACLTTSTRAHVIVDLLGVWRRADGAPPPDPEPTPDPMSEPPIVDSGAGDADAGVGGSPADGGPAGSGCACRAAGPPRAPVAGTTLLVLALLWWRRRRARSPSEPRAATRVS